MCCQLDPYRALHSDMPHRGQWVRYAPVPELLLLLVRDALVSELSLLASGATASGAQASINPLAGRHTLS